jgi:hypothetical protein
MKKMSYAGWFFLPFWVQFWRLNHKLIIQCGVLTRSKLGTQLKVIVHYVDL